MTRHDILVGLVVAGLDNLAVEGSTLLGDGGAVLVAHDARCKGLTEAERRLAILLTVQVLGEREDLVGRVLVHRQLSRRTDDDLCEGRVTHQDGEQTEQYVGGQSGVDAFAEEEKQSADDQRQEDADEPTLASKWQTAQDDACPKHTEEGGRRGALPVHHVDADGQEDQYEEEVNTRTCVVVEA